MRLTPAGLFLPLLALLLLSGSGARAASSSAADIILKKGRADAQDRAALVKGHVVQKGDTLSSILKEAGFAPADLAAVLSEVMELNEGLTDPDDIYPGQLLRLPDSRTAGGGKRRGVARSSALPGPGGQGETAVSSLVEGKRMLPILQRSFERLEERIETSGALVLPLSESTITLENDTYPLLDFSGGPSVIIDVGNRIPPETRTLLEKSWGGYSVLAPRPDETIRGFYGRILSAGGYYSLSQDPVTIGSESRIRIQPDFVIAKTADSLLDGRLFLLVFDGSGTAVLPPAIHGIVSEHRMEIIDVLSADGRESLPAGGVDDWPAMERKYTASDLFAMLSELLPALGVTRAGGEDITPGGELPGAVMYEGNGRRCAVFFTGAPDPGVRALLAERGTGSVAISSGEAFLTTLRRLLEELSMPAIGPMVEFYRFGDRHAVALPGLYLHLGERHILVTEGLIDRRLSTYLFENGIEVLTCLLPGEKG